VLPLLLTAVVAQADTVYSTPGLRDMVSRAAASNGAIPAGLGSYRAAVVSEVDFVIHTPTGGELSGQVEQFATDLAWQSDGSFRQHVVGHRAQAVGPNLSVVTYQRDGWIVPILYGQWLYFDRHSTAADQAARQRFRTVHPFSDDRDRVYSFEGGDTVELLRLPQRTVRVARIHVTPRSDAESPRVLVFHGDIDIDADRHVIVRMRGRLLVVGRQRGLAARLLAAAVLGAPYIELENGEYDGRFWLPVRQRVEFQATTPLTESRAVIRIVSRFRDVRTNVPVTVAGTPRSAPRLTFASSDTLARYDDWIADFGELTGGMNAADFADVAPDGLRPYGPPHFRFGARRLGDILRLNRVEGLYTGVAGVFSLRDAAPGLELRATVGRAWASETIRGSLEARFERGPADITVRGGRVVEHTNDFAAPLDHGFAPSIPLLLGTGDPFDYIERTGATARLGRSFDNGDAGVSIELGRLDDRPLARQLRRGPWGGDTLRLNRTVGAGTYHLQRVTVEGGRSVNATSLRPGIRSRLVLERASGTLAWNRIEMGVQVRGSRAPLTAMLRLDAGVVSANEPPPQVLYEMGGTNGLPGDSYKEFAGDRAALGRAMLMYTPGLLDAPLRLGTVVIPGPSPAIAVQLQSGWTDATRNAVPVLELLGSRETDGVRSSIDVQLVLFGGMFGIGAARPLRRGTDWRFFISVGGIL
jgi:hypothetical protein